MVEYHPAKHRRDDPTPIISFMEADDEGVLYPHDNRLVVTILVANFITHKILIDNGSSADILFWGAFARMGINVARLQLAPIPLKGFSGSMVQPMGTIALSVLVATSPCTTTVIVDFLVVKS